MSHLNLSWGNVTLFPLNLSLVPGVKRAIPRLQPLLRRFSAWSRRALPARAEDAPAALPSARNSATFQVFSSLKSPTIPRIAPALMGLM